VAHGDSLLTRLQRIIEQTYDWNTGIEDLGSFVVGDEGYRKLYGDKEIEEDLAGSSPVAKTLVSWRGSEIRLGLYYPDALILQLEARNPLHRVDDENVGAFAILVEELDHLLMLAWCMKHTKGVGLLELEFHANVTKYLVLALFLARLSRRSRLTPGQRHWLLLRLFNGAGEDLPSPFRQRYRTAARLAVNFIVQLDLLSLEDRVRALRRQSRGSWESLRSCLESHGPANGLGFLLAV
jgi:hypothetical protein